MDDCSCRASQRYSVHVSKGPTTAQIGTYALPAYCRLLTNTAEWLSPVGRNKPSRYVTGPRYTWWVTQAFRGPAEPSPVSQSGQTRGAGKVRSVRYRATSSAERN
jgi:hypothetical protein